VTTRRRHRLALIVLAVVAAACQPAGQGDPPHSPTQVPASDPASPSTAASSPPPSTGAASSAEAASPPLSLVVDPDLLLILPEDIDGVAIQADPDTASTLVGDPQLSAAASAVAMARYLGPGDSTGDDLAIVSVVQLRPGVYSDDFFQTWRSDYDGSACDPAGGLTGSGKETIGTYTVDVGTCAQGATTYHLRLEGDRLVSILAVGPHDLGVGVIEGLRP
jgi:hypothetical protein